MHLSSFAHEPLKYNFFGKLCEKLNRRFGNKDPHQAIRGKLQKLRQDDLSLEKFGENINKLVMDGYPGAAENIKEAIATGGCKCVPRN